MSPGYESRPAANGAARSLHGDTSSLRGTSDPLADLDAMAEALRGYFVVQVTIDDDGHKRTYLYRSAAAAERCVERAKARGRQSHVTLCSLLPAGVVIGLAGGGR